MFCDISIKVFRFIVGEKSKGVGERKVLAGARVETRGITGADREGNARAL